jgi:LysM repeat protein
MPERISREMFRDKKGAEIEQAQEEEYYPEDNYTPWKKNNMDSFMSNLSKGSGFLLVIVGAGIFILVALFVFLPMLRSPIDTKPITDMEAKLKKMEARLTEMDQNYQKVAQLAIQEDKLDQVSTRLDKLSANTTQRLDQLSKEMESSHRQGAPARTEPASKTPAAKEVKPETAHQKPATHGKADATPKKPAPVKKESVTVEPTKVESAPKAESAPKTEAAVPAKTAEAPEKKASAVKYHEVKPQETLYSISRSYGMNVDTLKRINNLGAADNIRIGQKLKVSQ